MLEKDSLAQLAAEITSQGYDEQTAWRFAALIGDTPGFDEHGNLAVLDDCGEIIARLRPLKFFSTD
jgi:hypothetical protein